MKEFLNDTMIRRWLYSILFLAAVLTGCMKEYEEDFLFRDFQIEFDDAPKVSNAPGKNYPMLGQVAKGSGLRTFKVNLIGGQKPAAQILKYRLIPEESTAVEGTHFRLTGDGTFELPANSSFGELSVEILDFPSENGSAAVVIELIGNDEIKASENYKRIGFSISLTGPPSQSHLLHTQLGPDSYYNTIAIDPMNPELTAGFKARWDQAAANLSAYADGGRYLHGMYISFIGDNKVTVVATYFGGGGTSLTSNAVATWTYTMALDAEGTGRLVFESANGNGNTQRANFAPLLADYLERYEFRVSWAGQEIASPPRDGVYLGGLFRTDDPSSYLFGSLVYTTPGIAPWPQQSSPVIYNLFNDGSGGFYNSVLINTDDPAQSEDFRARWAAAKANIASQPAGRQLHRMMFYYNPDFNDLRLVIYYYTSAGGRVIGQTRYQMKVGYDGVMKLQFVYQDANGAVTNTSQIMTDYLNVAEFTMESAGEGLIRFTRKDDPSSYFIGTTGNRSLNTSQFWPD